MTVELAIWLCIVLPGLIITGMNVYSAMQTLRIANRTKLKDLARKQMIIQVLMFVGMVGGMIVGSIAVQSEPGWTLKLLGLIGIYALPLSITLASIGIRKADYS